MVSAPTDRLATHLPKLPEIPVDVDEVTDRLRSLTETATSKARKATGRQASRPSPALPLALMLAVLAAVAGFMLVRSRRSTTDVGSESPAGSYAHT